MGRIKINLPEKFFYSTILPVQIGDINYGGHLANDALLRIAHEARLRFLNKHHLSELNIFNTSLIMGDAAIEYKSESFWGDELEVTLSIDDLGKVGFDFVYRVINTKTGKTVAIIKTGMVFYDYKEKKVCRPPEKFISFFQSLQ